MLARLAAEEALRKKQEELAARKRAEEEEARRLAALEAEKRRLADLAAQNEEDRLNAPYRCESMIHLESH